MALDAESVWQSTLEALPPDTTGLVWAQNLADAIDGLVTGKMEIGNIKTKPAVFTFANLAPRAWSHHKWYRKKFPDYPKQRRAVIPFIW